MNSKQNTIIFIVFFVISVAVFLSYSPKKKSSVRGMEDALKNHEVNETTSSFDWQKMLFIAVPTITIGFILIDVLKDQKKEEWDKYLKGD